MGMINLPIRKGCPKLRCFSALSVRGHNLSSLPGRSGRRWFDLKSAGPAPPARRIEVSSGVFGQEGYGSLRHASSVDWFIA